MAGKGASPCGSAPPNNGLPPDYVAAVARIGADRSGGPLPEPGSPRADFGAGRKANPRAVIASPCDAGNLPDPSRVNYRGALQGTASFRKGRRQP